MKNDYRKELSEFGFEGKILQDLYTLIKTYDELLYFMDNFFFLEEAPILMLDRYRCHRIKNDKKLTLNEFESLYWTNKKIALENLFKHFVHEQDVSLIQRLIEKGKITLEKIYKTHILDPTSRLLQII